MRKLVNLLVLTVTIASVCLNRSAEASLLGMPRALMKVYEHIRFAMPALPPMAFFQFCQRYDGECRPQHIICRGGPIKLTEQRWADLREINDRVNDSIVPERNLLGIAGEE